MAVVALDEDGAVVGATRARLFVMTRAAGGGIEPIEDREPTVTAALLSSSAPRANEAATTAAAAAAEEAGVEVGGTST